MAILWSDAEVTDLELSVDLDTEAPITKDHYGTFLSLNEDNKRRSYPAFRNKASRMRSKRRADKQESINVDDTHDDDLDRLREQMAIVTKENRRLKAQLKKLNNVNDLIIQAMTAQVATLPPFEPPKAYRHPTDRKFSPQVPMLDISDVHGGERVRLEDTGGLSEYGWDMCKSRAERLTKGVLSIIDMQRRGGIPLDTMVINMLGDIVTNEDIYTGQGLSIDLTLADQIVQLSNLLASEVIYPLAQVFPEVYINCVWGNHGRLSKKRGQKHKRSNADYLLYHMMRLRLADLENVVFRISQSSFMGYQVGVDPDRPHLIAHGDKVRRWMRIPYYGLARYQANLVALTKVPWAFTHIGHHHQSAQIDAPTGERLVNGSWIGATDYSVDRLQTGVQPKQSLIFLHPEYGATARYHVILGDRLSLEPDEEGLYTPIWKEDEEMTLR